MKIGILTTSYPGVTESNGGIGTYTYHLAQGLSALGHTVHVLTFSNVPGQTRDKDVILHLIRAKYFPLFDRILPGSGMCYRINRALRRIVTGYGLDVVEFPNWEGHGVLFSLVRQVPVVVRLHTSSLETQVIDGISGDRVARWDVRREKWLARSADTLVTHSEAHRSLMADELRVDRSRIRIVPHGVTVYPHFERKPRAGRDFTVVYLGRLEKRKGTLDLLNAIPQVLREVPQTRFVLIGTDRPHCPGGRTHAEYVQQNLDPEVRSRITLLGQVPDAEVDHWLQRADVFVAPSLYESFGLVFIEAMRWGTPVIGTTAGGIPEIIKDGETGLLVPPSSPAEVAKAVVSLLQDDNRRGHIGAAGRRHVEHYFSTERMSKNVGELYRQTIWQWQQRRFQ
jgi:glycosyltransferase involved in cell wall biosynthesis